VLAGNCNSCPGTLAAVANLRTGTFWFDAHGDFHTPETSLTGSLEGMSLTLATTEFAAEELVVLVGGRDLDPGEAERVSQRLIHVPSGDLHSQRLPACDQVYVHIDVDVFDPDISPGANFKGPGGLTPGKLMDALTFTFDRYRVAALAIANYNPEQDVDNRTLDIIVILIEHIERLRRDARCR
jgi:arginase